ncbi:MAG: hypothetical protein IJJ11_06300 [Methanosphaera sp.]|nr:hypothetical protein [Methanobrevibacter sp.]MBQ6444272.1 hypothetical protein [Methanosphaera sp.]
MANHHLSNKLLHIIGDEEEITGRILEEGDNNPQDFEENEIERDDVPFYDSLTGRTFANTFERDEWYAMYD